MPPTPNKRIKPLYLNIAFIVTGAAILLFLFNAPEETTAKLPNDTEHNRFQSMKIKEAKKFCTECHSPEGGHPLPQRTSPKYRCLSCHKRN